eukprot:scaffold7753_cov27-Phaeocystis_antarctica.AAC.1
MPLGTLDTLHGEVHARVCVRFLVCVLGRCWMRAEHAPGPPKSASRPPARALLWRSSVRPDTVVGGVFGRSCRGVCSTEVFAVPMP